MSLIPVSVALFRREVAGPFPRVPHRVKFRFAFLAEDRR
jgi:hypothetical protein